MEDPPETFEEFTPRAVSSMAQGESVDVEPTVINPQTGPEEPEKPIGPHQNLDKIISETEDIVREQLNIIIDQRRFIRTIYYKIDALQTLVEDHFKPHVARINTFLLKSDKFQERWLKNYLLVLPTYGDYTVVLKNSPSLINVQEIPRPIEESSLKSFTEEVTNGIYASAMQVREMRTRNLDMNRHMNQFREVCQKNYLPYKKWLEMCKLYLDNLEALQTECFDDVSNIDFND